MKKAILVMDMPENCKECRLRFEDDYSDWCPCDVKRIGTTDVFDYVKKLTKPEWCPLRPVPEKYDMHEAITQDPDYNAEYGFGYNACIDKILGE